MSRIHGFPPLARPDAIVLILGSMPSRESLAQGQYYAHPRNAFWPILARVLEMRTEDYAERAALAMERGVAVWDVFRDCVRPGSLDSAIDERTAATNDFSAFFDEHPAIRRILFNGAKAESVFLRRVLPGLDERRAAIPRLRLPSTSPAHAGMRFEDKLAAWKAALAPGLE